MSHKRGRDKKANEKREAIRLERCFIGNGFAPISNAIDSGNYQESHRLESFIVRVTKLHWFADWRKSILSRPMPQCPKCGSSLLWGDVLPVACGNPECNRVRHDEAQREDG